MRRVARLTQICPTQHRPNCDGLVTVQHLISNDYATLFETCDVPQEFLAVVIVHFVVGPNSAPSWGAAHTEPRCSQLLFFDTRKTVRDMSDTISQMRKNDHVWSPVSLTLPLESDRIDSELRECVCGLKNCPGEKWRAEAPKRRFTPSRMSTSASPLRYDHDEMLTAAATSTSSGGEQRCEPGCCPLAGGLQEYWMYVDATTNVPLSGETCTCEGTTENKCVRSKLGPKSDPDYRIEMDAPLAEQPTHCPLKLLCINATQVIRAHGTSPHRTHMCALRILPFLTSERIAGAITKLPGWKRRYMILTTMAHIAIARRGASDSAHPFHCSCLFEHVVSTRCTKQLTIKAYPLGGNSIYRTLGDSINDVRSYASRLVASRIAHTELMAQKLMTAADVSWNVDRQHDELHFENVLNTNRAFRKLFIQQMGPYRVENLGNGRREFRPSAAALKPGEQRHGGGGAAATSKDCAASGGIESAVWERRDWYAPYLPKTQSVAPLPKTGLYSIASVSRPGSAAALSALGHDGALAEARRLFALEARCVDKDESLALSIEQCRTLREVAFRVGLFDDDSIWLRYTDWATPTVDTMLRFIREHPDDFDFEIEYAIAKLSKHHKAADVEKRLTAALSWDGLIFDELARTDNRRIALARIADVLLSCVYHMDTFRFGIFAVGLSIVLALLCDRLLALRANPPKMAPTTSSISTASPQQSRTTSTAPPPPQKSPPKAAAVVVEKKDVNEKKKDVVERKNNNDKKKNKPRRYQFNQRKPQEAAGQLEEMTFEAFPDDFVLVTCSKRSNKRLSPKHGNSARENETTTTTLPPSSANDSETTSESAETETMSDNDDTKMQTTATSEKPSPPVPPPLDTLTTFLKSAVLLDQFDFFALDPELLDLERERDCGNGDSIWARSSDNIASRVLDGVLVALSVN